MTLSNSRWIPRLTGILQGFVYRMEPATSSYKYSPAIRSILSQAKMKLEQPDNVQQLDSPLQSRVFANNYLNLNDVGVVGFDLDYTLVPYTVELQNLIYTMARDILVTAYGFPKDLKTCFFDPDFAIRGLSVDTRHGVLVKMSQMQRISVRYSYLGKRLMSTEEMERCYGTSHHIPYGDMSMMRQLHDLFSLAEACLIADCIEIFEHRKNTRGETYAPSAMIDDVQAAVRDVHLSGEMHNAIVQDLDRFVKRNSQLANMLLHLKRSGKQLFLCTNSGFKYANSAMAYALGYSQQEISKGIRCDWRELFDVTICNAQKPDFFFSKKPFRRWNIEFDRPSIEPVGALVNNEVYAHGSVHSLQRAKPDWMGKNVLYVGDNLRADIVEARRWHGWHTAAVIDELDREIDIQNSSSFVELHMLRSTLRQLLNDIQLAMMEDMTAMLASHRSAQSNARLTSAELDASDDRLINEYLRDNRNMNEDELLRSLESELRSVNSELSCLFNPQFGSMFRTDGHPSLFAFSIRRYADLYMSNVCNLINYSANHRFYPAHALHMAHDPVL